MNVKDAIDLMARNPAVGFPWEPTLVNLVNGFLPSGCQLDPHTAEALEIQNAIDSLDASIQEMVLTSSIGAANVAASVPTPSIPAPKQSKADLQKWAGFLVCIFALSIAAKIGDGAIVLEIIKVFAPLLGVDLPSGQ